ncbi:MAG: ArnT family glycosyltransferase [Promethearchaeota archaeon]
MEKMKLQKAIRKFISLLVNKKIIMISIIYYSLTIPGIFWGVDFLNPPKFLNTYYGDEARLDVVFHHMIENKGDPGFYIWPSLFFYFAYSIYLPISFLFPSVNQNILMFITIRTINVILGGISTLVVYKIGKEYKFHENCENVRKTRGEIVALSFISIPFFIYISPIMVTESLLLLFSSLTIFFLQRSINHSKDKYFLYSCIFASLAFSTKYNGFILVFALVITLIKFRKKYRLKFISIFLASLSLYAGIFILINIYMILNWFQSIDGIMDNFLMIFTGSYNITNLVNGYTMGPGYSGIDYVINSYLRVVSIVLLVFFGFGIAMLINEYAHSKNEKFKVLTKSLLSCLVVLYLLTFMLSNFKARYLVPSFPIFALICGIGLEKLLKKVRNLKHLRGKKRIFRVFLITLFIFSIFSLLSFDLSITLMKNRDTRVVASRWIKENIPDDIRLGIDAYVTIPANYKANLIIDSLSPENLSRFYYKYLIISQAQYERWTLIDPDTYKNQSTFYLMLFNGSSKYTLIKKFEIKDYSAFHFRSTVIYSFGIKVIWEYFTDPYAMWGTGIYIFELKE